MPKPSRLKIGDTADYKSALRPLRLLGTLAPPSNFFISVHQCSSAVSTASSCLKRAFDIFFSAFGLVVLSPVLLLLAIAVKLSSRGPVLFRQQRIGKDGRPFYIVKFRSMVADADRLGLGITRDGDPRVTRLGRFLRRLKLDELPQLWNVLRGDMSFVGPRPEVPRYVAKYTEEQRKVLALKPGITDLATLEFRNEEELLRTRAEDGGQRTEDADTEKFYLEHCVPRKIELNLAYAQQASLWEDLKIILRTVCPGLPLRSRVEGQGKKLKGEN